MYKSWRRFSKSEALNVKSNGSSIRYGSDTFWTASPKAPIYMNHIIYHGVESKIHGSRWWKLRAIHRPPSLKFDAENNNDCTWVFNHCACILPLYHGSYASCGDQRRPVSTCFKNKNRIIWSSQLWNQLIIRAFVESNEWYINQEKCIFNKRSKVEIYCVNIKF